MLTVMYEYPYMQSIVEAITELNDDSENKQNWHNYGNK